MSLGNSLGNIAGLSQCVPIEQLDVVEFLTIDHYLHH